MKASLNGLKARGFQPKQIADVGAARGDWARLTLDVWPEARITAFEPLQEHHELLAELAKEKPSVRVSHAGVGREKGRASFGVTRDLDGSSLMYPGEDNREIEIVCLDDVFAANNTTLDLLKMDVQGAEMMVLEGSEKVLGKCSIIIAEAAFFRFTPETRIIHEMIAWLAQRGFVPYEMIGGGPRPLDGAMAQCDIMFCREDHPLRADQRWSA